MCRVTAGAVGLVCVDVGCSTGRQVLQRVSVCHLVLVAVLCALAPGLAHWPACRRMWHQGVCGRTSGCMSSVCGRGHVGRGVGQ